MRGLDESMVMAMAKGADGNIPGNDESAIVQNFLLSMPDNHKKNGRSNRMRHSQTHKAKGSQTEIQSVEQVKSVQNDSTGGQQNFQSPPIVQTSVIVTHTDEHTKQDIEPSSFANAIGVNTTVKMSEKGQSDRWANNTSQKYHQTETNNDDFDMMESGLGDQHQTGATITSSMAYQKMEDQVAIFGQSFKINLKFRNKEKNDLPVDIGKRECSTKYNSPPIPANIQLSQENPQITTKSFLSSHQIKIKNNKMPALPVNQLFQGKKKLQACHLNDLGISGMDGPTRTQNLSIAPFLKNHSETRKATAPGSSRFQSQNPVVPRLLTIPNQQPNTKHGIHYNRHVNILQPTEYQPQLDMIHVQNTVQVARRAQEIYRTSHLKNKGNKNNLSDLSKNSVFGNPLNNRPRTIEETRLRKLNKPQPLQSTLNNQYNPNETIILSEPDNPTPQPSDITQYPPLLLQHHNNQDGDEASSLTVINEQTKKKQARASALSQSAEGQLPKLKEDEQRQSELRAVGAPSPVRVQIMSGVEQQKVSMSISKNHQFRVSPSFTLKYQSQQANDSQQNLEGSIPVTKLLSQTSLPEEVDAIVRSSQGCKTTQSDLKTVFTQKFDGLVENNNRQNVNSKQRTTVIASNATRKGQKSQEHAQRPRNLGKLSPDGHRKVILNGIQKLDLQNINLTNKAQEEPTQNTQITQKSRIDLQQIMQITDNERDSACTKVQEEQIKNVDSIVSSGRQQNQHGSVGPSAIPGHLKKVKQFQKLQCKTKNIDQILLPDLNEQLIVQNSVKKPQGPHLGMSKRIRGNYASSMQNECNLNLMAHPKNVQIFKDHQKFNTLDPKMMEQQQQFLLKGKYQNSFFNRQFERILLNQMMKGLVQKELQTFSETAQETVIVDKSDENETNATKEHPRDHTPPLTSFRKEPFEIKIHESEDTHTTPQNLGPSQKYTPHNHKDIVNTLMTASLDECIQDSENYEDPGLDSQQISQRHSQFQRDIVDTARLTQQHRAQSGGTGSLINSQDWQQLKESKQQVQQTQFQQNDQIVTKKHNQFYKQVRNLQKDGQEIVISHPYDMSHLVNVDKSFLTSTNLVNRRKELMELKKAKYPRNINGLKNEGLLKAKVPSTRIANRFISNLSQNYEQTTPKEAKQLWLKKAYESTQQGLIVFTTNQQNYTDRSLQKRSVLSNQNQFHAQMGKVKEAKNKRSPVQTAVNRKQNNSVGSSDQQTKIHGHEAGRISRNNRQRQSYKKSDDQDLYDQQLAHLEKDEINFNTKMPLNEPKRSTNYRVQSKISHKDGKDNKYNSISPVNKVNRTHIQQRGSKVSPLQLTQNFDEGNSSGLNHLQNVRKFEQINDLIIEQNREQDYSTRNHGDESCEREPSSPQTKKRKQNKVYIQSLIGPEIKEPKEEKFATTQISTYQDQHVENNINDLSPQGRQIAYSNFGSPRKRFQIEKHSKQRGKIDANLFEQQSIQLKSSLQGPDVLESVEQVNSTPNQGLRSGWDNHNQQSMTMVSDYISNTLDKSKKKLAKNESQNAKKVATISPILESRVITNQNDNQIGGLSLIADKNDNLTKASQETFNQKQLGGDEIEKSDADSKLIPLSKVQISQEDVQSHDPKSIISIQNPIYHKVRISYQQPVQQVTKPVEKQEIVAPPSFLHINQVVLQSRDDEPLIQQPPQQSPRRQFFLTRKQTKGYAGGVIGSGVDASLYMGTSSVSPKQPLIDKKRPKTKDGNWRVGPKQDQILIQNFKQYQQQQQQALFPLKHQPDDSFKAKQRTKNHNYWEAYNGGKTKNQIDESKIRGHMEQYSMQQHPTLGAPFFGWPNETTDSSQPFSSPNLEHSQSPKDDMRMIYLNKTTAQDINTLHNSGQKFRNTDYNGPISQNTGFVQTSQQKNLTNNVINDIRSSGTDHFSGLGASVAPDVFKPLNTKEIRLNCRFQQKQQILDGERKRISSQQTVHRKNFQSLPIGQNNYQHDKFIKVMSLSNTQRKHIRVQENQAQPNIASSTADQPNNTLDFEQQSVPAYSEKPLDDYTVQILRQKTLYKMQKNLWNKYENEWNEFKRRDHVSAQAPIPPNCKILPLHIYLTNQKLSQRQLRAQPIPLSERQSVECSSGYNKTTQVPSILKNNFKSVDDPTACLVTFSTPTHLQNQKTQKIPNISATAPTNDLTHHQTSIGSLQGPQRSVINGSQKIDQTIKFTINNSNQHSIGPIPNASFIDSSTFEDCYKESKRRLLMCSFRIMDELAVVQMKCDLEQGYKQIMLAIQKRTQPLQMQINNDRTNVPRNPAGRRLLIECEDLSLEGCLDEAEDRKLKSDMRSTSKQQKEYSVRDEEHEKTIIRRHTSIEAREDPGLSQPYYDIDEIKAPQTINVVEDCADEDCQQQQKTSNTVGGAALPSNIQQDAAYPINTNDMYSQPADIPQELTSLTGGTGAVTLQLNQSELQQTSDKNIPDPQ